jgi:hypothetical protein
MTATGGLAVDDLEWLQQWYAVQCNGDWEQDRGVTIDSLDNPGWWLKVDLAGTPYEARATDALLHRSGEPPTAERGSVGGPDWMECRIKDRQFHAAGDPRKLRALVRAFREWVTQA